MHHSADASRGDGTPRQSDGDITSVFRTSLPRGFFFIDEGDRVTAAEGDCPLLDSRLPAACVGSDAAGLLCPSAPEAAIRAFGQVRTSRRFVTVETRQGARSLAFTIMPAGTGEALAIVVQEAAGSPVARDCTDACCMMLSKGLSAILLIVDPVTGRIIDANQSAADFYGWTVAELRGMDLMQLDVDPASLQPPFLQKHCRSGAPAVLRHLLRDGSTHELEAFCSMIEPNGVPLVYAILHDVTERNRGMALDEFRVSLYQEAAGSSVDELLRIALEKAERESSSCFGVFHFLGGRSDGDLPSVWSNLLHPWKSDSHAGQHRHTMETWKELAVAVQQRQTLVLNDFPPIIEAGGMAGCHPMVRRALVVPIVWCDEVPAVFVVGNKPSPYTREDVSRVEGIAEIAWDIVSRMRAAESERRMQAALLHIQKGELVGQIAAGIAHDFNNMLSVIIGNAEIAMDFGEGGELVAHSLQEILTAAERSAGITTQLLAFACKQPATPEVLDLNLAVSDALPKLRRLVGESITIVMEPAQGDSMVLIDPFQLEQIMSNICANARDAIAAEGSVTISLGHQHLEQSRFDQYSPVSAGDYVVLTFRDTGSGISAKDLGHIFEPFFTTRDMGQRTGLGLSTVYGIVKQHNGFVEVESEPGRGTELRVCLPSCAASGVKPAQPGGVADNGTGLGAILLVEDEPDILKICRTMLEELGYQVFATASPSDALRIVAEYGDRIELLMTDVVMPEMTGRELANRVSLIHPDIRTLFMSGYAANMIAEHDVSPGVNFIAKPFTRKGLAAVMRHILPTVY